MLLEVPGQAGVAVHGLRDHVLEALEHATLTIRGIARSLNDSAGLSHEVNPVRDPHAASRVADELRALAAALRAYGQLARSKSVDRGALKADVDRHLAAATENHGEVADIMRADPAAPSPGWPLPGELVTHLDRLHRTARRARWARSMFANATILRVVLRLDRVVGG